MTAPQKPQLTRDQADTVDFARKALAAISSDPDKDVMNLAGNVGRLQYHVGELLALVAELTGGAS